MENKRVKMDRPDDSLIGVFSVFPWEITQLIWNFVLWDNTGSFARVCRTMNAYYRSTKFTIFEDQMKEPAFMRSVINAVIARLAKARADFFCATDEHISKKSITYLHCFTAIVSTDDHQAGDNRIETDRCSEDLNGYNVDLIDERAICALSAEDLAEYKQIRFCISDKYTLKIRIIQVLREMASVAKRLSFVVKFTGSAFNPRDSETSVENLFRAVKDFIY